MCCRKNSIVRWRACRALGIKTVAVTAGYITTEARKDFYSVIDAANVDLKAFTERFYEKLCFAHLGPAGFRLPGIEYTPTYLSRTSGLTSYGSKAGI